VPHTKRRQMMLAAVIMDVGARSQMAKARQRHQQTPP
jgi:hypothetical protein